MTTLRPFSVDDLFRFNNVNCDALTETYHQPFYLQYLAQWPQLFEANEAPDGRIMGYMMAKVEGVGENWHGHVTAVTVAPEFRRLGLAKALMRSLEQRSEKVHDGYFVDLFVRESNALAIAMYKSFGYNVYRRVIGYYSDSPNTPGEDALDMRKALARDPEKKSMIPLNNPVYPEDVDD